MDLISPISYSFPGSRLTLPLTFKPPVMKAFCAFTLPSARPMKVSDWKMKIEWPSYLSWTSSVPTITQSNWDIYSNRSLAELLYNIYTPLNPPGRLAGPFVTLPSFFISMLRSISVVPTVDKAPNLHPDSFLPLTILHIKLKDSICLW